MEDWKKARDEKQSVLKEEVATISNAKKVGGAVRKKKPVVVEPPVVQEEEKTEEIVVEVEVPQQKEEAVVVEEAPKVAVEKKAKKNPNAYINFLSQMREQFKKENPDVPSKEVSSRLSQLWKTYSDEEKAKYK